MLQENLQVLRITHVKIQKSSCVNVFLLPPELDYNFFHGCINITHT